MAELKPYDPNKPVISIKNDGNLIDRLSAAGIPLTRVLKYFHENPEAGALETLKIAAEERVPFYGNYMNDSDISDYIKEAVLMAVPMPRGSGKRYKVRTDVNGVPDFNDLQKWAKDKASQYDSFLDSRPSYRLAEAQKDLYNFNKLKKYLDPVQAAKLEPKLRNDVNAAALDVLDESPYYDKVENWGLIPDNAMFKEQVSRSKYIYDKLIDEYGPVDGTYYYHKLWKSDYEKYLHPEDIGVDAGLFERMLNKYLK